MNKMLRVFLNNLDDIKLLNDRRRITTNFRHGIKPKASYIVPKILCAVKVRRADEDAEDAQYHKDMEVIPSMYLRATRSERKRRRHYILLRQEAYTSLAEIKMHYYRTHQHLTSLEQRRNLRNAAFSIDGVQETKHGSRTLILVTVQFGKCIFLWHVLNPLKKKTGAKPSAEELLR